MHHTQRIPKHQCLGNTKLTRVISIIAIMLGRLRMSLDECEQAYLELSHKIFRPKRCKYSPMKIIDGYSLSERFDSTVLEKLMKKVIKERTGSEHHLLQDGGSPKSSPCKV